MHIHILGICGTFMGGLAMLARQLGYTVTGSDANVYPPMSVQLEEQGISLIEGYDPSQLDPAPDLVVVGNAMSRGNETVEYMLERGIPFISGPQWLFEHLLKDRWVLAVAGTHGKTTTSSMLAWILEFAGMKPGFLIGGIPSNFGVSAALGDSAFFVIEADEYDSAFFDKRSKFVHYHPRTAILNNLEFDHADIFDNLEAIAKQFHHLIRIIPRNGLVIVPESDSNIGRVLEKGLWSELEKTSSNRSEGARWSADLLNSDGSLFSVWMDGINIGSVDWPQTGMHNIDNALAAIAAARHVGVRPAIAVEALCLFTGVKRRMELLGVPNGISVYDDFAHHPTAIETTLAGLRAKVGKKKIIAVIEPRSHTMRLGSHLGSLAGASRDADLVIWYQPKGMDWSLESVVSNSSNKACVSDSIDGIIATVVENARAGDHVVIMSNGGFSGIHQQLLAALN
ncbi:MAG: UDP-N-acetylmuramate: L-alanyl-gamma-D-glutamyl-meso-diaminopimelate ligase [Oceanicoccus sp.]|jgi:UDP-N-acetylmuramate: L-alanyl-gamma-D-glutamyl-meso-diaminopimelate ligase